MLDPATGSDDGSDGTPEHLRVLDQAIITEITALVCATYGRAMPAAVSIELVGLIDDPTHHMARRLASALEACGGIGCAAAVDALLLGEGRTQ